MPPPRKPSRLLGDRDHRPSRRGREIDRAAVPGSERARRNSPLDPTRQSLDAEDRNHLRRTLQVLADQLCDRLEAPRVRVRVLGVRPTISRGTAELHGAYEGEEGARTIEVWMRTSAHKRVVRHRTFLRTFLHEFLHHLDMTRLDLPNSFHTEGFFKRESHLMAQLAPK